VKGLGLNEQWADFGLTGVQRLFGYSIVDNYTIFGLEFSLHGQAGKGCHLVGRLSQKE
jgi:hypothetical protein